MTVSDPDSGATLTVTFVGYPTGLTADGVPLVWSGLGTNTITGTASGTTLTLTINNSGAYTVTLSGGGLNHVSGNGENLLNFTANVQVSDGTLTDTALLSVTLEDDSPVNFNPVDLTDETGATATLLDDALVNNGSANVTRVINDSNATPATGENFVGADGYGSLVFTAAGHTNGEALENSGGTPLTSGGDPIYVFGFGTGVLTATTSANNSDPAAVVFTVTLTPGAGSGAASTYTIDFNQTIDDGGGFVFDDFSSAPAGQNDWVGLDADGFDINDPLDPNANSEDLLLTPTNVGGSINTSATDIGNSNQWVDISEGVRLDYVVDVRRDPGSDEKDVGGYTFDGHYTVTDSSFSIMQTQGGGTASVRITAFNDPDTGNLDTLSGTIIPIDPASIVVTGDATYTVVVMADGSVVVSGLAPGASVEFETIGDVAFNAYSVTNANGVANPNGGTFTSDAFALGVFGFNSETQGNPIDMSFDVTASDSDGDTSTGTIDVTLVPAPLGMEALSTKSMLTAMDEQQAANTNTVLLGAIAGAGLLSASQAAAAPSFDFADFDYGSFSQSSLLSSTSLQSFDYQSLSPLTESTMVARWEGQSFGHSGPNFEQATFASDGLAPASMDLPALSQLAQGYDMPVNMDAAYGSSFASADVVIPSLEALVASYAQNGGATELSGVVADVLSDALAGGGEGLNIDSLLDGLPGLGGTGMDALASHGMTGVSAWDMGAFGGFTGIHQAFTMETLALHQDGVMPQA